MAGMNHAKLSRRKFLGLTATGVGLLAAGPRLWAGAKASSQTGIQLYTLRDMMAESVPDTLKLVADIGYNELEFAGYFGHKPAAIRKILEAEGMTAPSAHVPLQVLEEGVEGTIEAALELGHKYVVVPYLDDKQRSGGIDRYKFLAEQFNGWGEKFKEAGITFGYHNHAFEFDVTDGQIPYHVLLAETDPSKVAMELDLFWTVKANRDPLDYFQKYPGRFPLWHVKDMDKKGEFADLGDGVIDFKRIFAAAEASGLQHAFVENDQPKDAVVTARKGHAVMKQLKTRL
jgi:sugar phosphate isomerase/epimerase